MRIISVDFLRLVLPYQTRTTVKPGLPCERQVKKKQNLSFFSVLLDYNLKYQTEVLITCSAISCSLTFTDLP
jgi:lipopolysaccharide/colanic/teichoic acid biosynthesis glycosyltransferase